MPRGKRSARNRVLAPTATAYSGSVTKGLANNSSVPVEVLITSAQLLTLSQASPAGVFNFRDVTGATQWDNYKQLYDEYRVLGMEMLQPPTAELDLSGRDADPLIAMWSYRAGLDLPQAPSSLQEAAMYDDFTWCSNAQQTIKSIRMNGTYESNFFSTDASTATELESDTGLGVGCFSDFAEATVLSLPVVLKWRVQFRGTKAVTLGAKRAVATSVPLRPDPSPAVKTADAAGLLTLARALLEATGEHG